MANFKKVVFITGCSSGIGAAMAHEFHRRGHIVYATARRLDSLEPLARSGIATLQCDVTDDASIKAAFDVVAANHGKIDLLINNAGYSQVGAMLDLSRDDFRRQFETNVISPIAVTRGAIQLLCAASAIGKNMAVVANMGSIVGIVATPFAGAYSASKAALHSISDTLRMELAPLGVRVVTVQAGNVTSNFGANAEAAVRMPPEDSPYRAISDLVRARAMAGQRDSTPMNEFILGIVNELVKGKPPLIIRRARNSFRGPLLKKLLPMEFLDNKIAAMFGLEPSLNEKIKQISDR